MSTHPPMLLASCFTIELDASPCGKTSCLGKAVVICFQGGHVLFLAIARFSSG